MHSCTCVLVLINLIFSTAKFFFSTIKPIRIVLKLDKHKGVRRTPYMRCTVVIIIRALDLYIVVTISDPSLIFEVDVLFSSSFGWQIGFAVKCKITHWVNSKAVI